MFGVARTQVVRQQDYIHRLEERRENEARVATMHHYRDENKRWKANHMSDVRVEKKRRQQRIGQQQDELQTLENYEREEREKQQREILREQDEQLSSALYDMKTQRQAEETNARRICEESEELKELKEKLRAAKISKVRATQLQERALLDRHELTQDRAMDSMMEQDRQAALEREHGEAQRKFFMNLQSRSVLQNQIAERQTKKKEAYEAFLREKAMVDDIVKGIEDEDRAKLVAHKKKQEELQTNIRAYLQDRAVWRQAEKERAEAELRKIQEYNARQAERHEEMMQKKQAVADQQVEVLRKLGKEIETKRREEEEMRALLDELYMEEAEQKALERLQSDQDKRDRMKQEMFDANEKQKALKLQRAQEMREEEEKFREDMLNKFAADRRLEQMNETRRRREMQNYRAEVERLVQERRNMYEAAVEAEEAERSRLGEQEAYRLAVVERERQRLLREHADDLKDYLPKGVLRDNKDYEVIYGQQPKQDPNAEDVRFITERNKRSIINLGGNPRTLRSKDRTGGNKRDEKNSWWGDGAVVESRAPSAGRRGPPK